MMFYAYYSDVTTDV